MTTPIDYSRPVGWWCPVCGMERWRYSLIRKHTHAPIPCYLPIPEGQRPPAASEVEEAEVVTWYSSPSPSTPFTGVMGLSRDDCGVRWRETVLEGMDLAAAVQRIVTGATE